MRGPAPSDDRRETPERMRAARAWLLVVGWIGLVLWLGSSGFGMPMSQRFIHPLLRWLQPDLTRTELVEMTLAIRKVAHVLVYAVLALVSLRAWRLTLPARPLRAALLAGSLALLVAVVDESRQSMLWDRHGTAVDVAIDGAGAFAAVTGALLVARYRRGSAPR